MDAPENKRQESEVGSTSSASPSSSSSVEISTPIEDLSSSSGSTQSGIESLLKQVAAEEPKPEIVEEKKPEEKAPEGETGAGDGSTDIDAILKQVSAEEPKPEIVEEKKLEEKAPEGAAGLESHSEVVKEESAEKIVEETVHFLSEPSVDSAPIPAPERSKNTVPLESKIKDFDISTDPDVVEMRARMKEKVQEILKSFINYKTFSISFILQMPKVVLRRRKVKLGLKSFSEWIEIERKKIQEIEDSVKKGTLEKASVVFDLEMLSLKRKGLSWIRQGWRKSFLVIIWIVATTVGLLVGIPSVFRIYLPSPLRPAVSKEMDLVGSISPHSPKKAVGPVSYLLLSCEESEMGKLGKIRVYDREGKQVAVYPPNVNTMKKKVLTEVPAGELGVIIETDEYPIVGTLELMPGQRRFIDLSKWTDVEARAMARITSAPEGIPIVCDGAWVGKGFASVYLIAGVHKIWAALPNFPAQEQQIMVVDDRELDLMVTVNMGRLIFKVPDQIKKMHPQLKIFVNGSLILNWESYPLLFGYYTIKIIDSGRTILQQELNLSAADEALFQVHALEGGQLSGSMISKRNLLQTN